MLICINTQVRDISLNASDSELTFSPVFSKCSKTKRRVKGVSSDGLAVLNSFGNTKTPSPIEMKSLFQSVDFAFLHNGNRYT